MDIYKIKNGISAHVEKIKRELIVYSQKSTFTSDIAVGMG